MEKWVSAFESCLCHKDVQFLVTLASCFVRKSMKAKPRWSPVPDSFLGKRTVFNSPNVPNSSLSSFCVASNGKLRTKILEDFCLVAEDDFLLTSFLKIKENATTVSFYSKWARTIEWIEDRCNKLTSVSCWTFWAPNYAHQVHSPE